MKIHVTMSYYSTFLYVFTSFVKILLLYLCLIQKLLLYLPQKELCPKYLNTLALFSSFILMNMNPFTLMY